MPATDRARSGRSLAAGALLLAVITAGAAGAAGVEDTAAPTTTARLTSAVPASPSGWFRSPVDVRLEAADAGGSGIARTEYRLAGGDWTAAGPDGTVRVPGGGEHTVEYRSVDAAGNVEATRSVSFRIDANAPALTTQVTHGAEAATVAVTADDRLTGAGATEIAFRVDGGAWQPVALEERIFDGTKATFDRWRMVGGGRFELTADGAMRTVGGMGMLWWPVRQLGDAVLRLQWRDARADGARSNGGVFVRFPDPEKAVAVPPQERHACQVGLGLFLAEWSAVGCGHEIQVNDGGSDPQKTGSVYNFRPLNAEQSRPTPHGEWNEYEVRTVGGGSYAVTVVRNGEVINRWVNTPGQRPARAYDPPTDLRQFASGFVGLQNHGSADTIDYRDVRVLDLAPATASFVIGGAGTRSVQVRATDDAGNAAITSFEVHLP